MSILCLPFNNIVCISVSQILIIRITFSRFAYCFSVDDLIKPCRCHPGFSNYRPMWYHYCLGGSVFI